MINHLDLTLRELLLAELSQVNQPSQVRFDPPDNAWQTHVSQLGTRLALNVFLCDLRENRSERTTFRRRSTLNGVVTETTPPRQLDCHYWITAWNPAAPSATIEPSLAEHELLYDTIAVLSRPSITPREVYGGTPPPGFPAAIVDAPLTLTVVAQEAHQKMTDYWATFDRAHKPGAHLVVSLPIIRTQPPVESHEVITRVLDVHASTSGTAHPDVLVQVGGRVSDAGNPLPGGRPAPVGDIEVRLLTPTDEVLQSTRTDAEGRFSFQRVESGAYKLQALAPGKGVVTAPVDIPATTGDYELQYT